MFVWTADKIRFMRDASEYTDFYRQLAACIAGYLPPDAHVCDAGCGLGYLSVELSRYVKTVSAVDISPEAAQVLVGNIEARELSNINVYCGDFSHFASAQSFDAIVFCFFEKMEKILSIMQACHTKKAIAVKNNASFRRFSAKREHKGAETFEEAKRCLEARHIHYAATTITADFGQPFNSLEDAQSFFQYYGNVEEVKDPLTRIGQDPKGVFPYYMPSQKSVGVIAFDAEEIKLAV